MLRVDDHFSRDEGGLPGALEAVRLLFIGGDARLRDRERSGMRADSSVATLGTESRVIEVLAHDGRYAVGRALADLRGVLGASVCEARRAALVPRIDTAREPRAPDPETI